MKNKIIGLDFGSKTVGVALSDELLIMAHPYTTIFRERENKLRQTIAEIRKIIEDNHVNKIVLGLPIHADGSFGERANKTLEFKSILEKKIGLDVVLVDEGLSTVESDEVLSTCGIPASMRKKHIDSVAAAVILQEYLENQDRFERNMYNYET